MKDIIISFNDDVTRSKTIYGQDIREGNNFVVVTRSTGTEEWIPVNTIKSIIVQEHQEYYK